MAAPPGCGLFDRWLQPCQPDDGLLNGLLARQAECPDQRLGKLFEQLVEIAITSQPHLELAARNVVIEEAGRTLGELDMLVRDRRDGHILHVELTLKFYLALPGGQFPGPNPSDSLARKYRRLRDHQFPLLRNPQTVHQLRKQGIDRIDSQLLFSRGRIFYPPAWPEPVSAMLSPDHQRGRWWYASETPPDCQWRVIRRPQWLAPDTLSDMPEHQLASTDLIDYVRSLQRPVMVTTEAPQAEGMPAFVVPDNNWPAPAGDPDASHSQPTR